MVIYKREYYCESCDRISIDLEVTKKDNVYTYVVINTGTKEVYGDILIYSNVFDKLRYKDIYLVDRLTFTEISNSKQEEEARAYLKFKCDTWVYSNLWKLRLGSSTSSTSPTSSTSSTSPTSPTSPSSPASSTEGSYLCVTTFNNRSASNKYRLQFTISNNGTVTSGLVNFIITNPVVPFLPGTVFYFKLSNGDRLMFYNTSIGTQLKAPYRGLEPGENITFVMDDLTKSVLPWIYDIILDEDGERLPLRKAVTGYCI